MTPERIAELRAIAEAATPGHWGATVEDEWCNWIHNHAGADVVSLEWYDPSDAEVCIRGADATHIAAFDPPMVLGLLDEVERLRKLQGIHGAHQHCRALADVLREDNAKLEADNARLRGALADLLKGGAHDGDCDNGYRDDDGVWHSYREACSIHMTSYVARRADARAALGLLEDK